MLWVVYVRWSDESPPRGVVLGETRAIFPAPVPSENVCVRMLVMSGLALPWLEGLFTLTLTGERPWPSGLSSLGLM